MSITQDYNKARLASPGLTFTQYKASLGGLSPALGNQPAPVASANLPTTSNVFNRDLDREENVAKKLGITGNYGMQLASNPVYLKQLFEATYKPNELAGIKDYQDLISKDKEREALGAQTAQIRQNAPNALLALEDALRTKVDVGNQQIGQSELFKKAGLEGYFNLNQSLSQNAKDMEYRYGSFVNALSRAGNFMTNQYKGLADQYKTLTEEYTAKSTELQNTLKDINDFSQQMALIEKQAQNAKELYDWQQSYEDRKLKEENESIYNDFKSGVIRSAQTSDISNQNIIDDKNPFGDNCVLYQRNVEGVEMPFGLYNVNDRMKAIQLAGSKDMNKIQVGDVIQTSEGTQVDENGIPIGHTARVIGIDGDNLILREANYVSGKVTEGRKLNKNDKVILGFNPQNEKLEIPMTAISENYNREGQAPSIEDQLILKTKETGAVDSTLKQKFLQDANTLGLRGKDAEKFAMDQITASYKPLTEAESASVLAYGVMSQERPHYDSLMEGINPEKFAESINFITKKIKDDGLTSQIINENIDDPNIRQALMSEMRWIEGLLRKKSGAAITKEEYTTYGTMYFPRSGDDPATINRKRYARERAEDDVYITMGASGKRQVEENKKKQAKEEEKNLQKLREQLKTPNANQKKEIDAAKIQLQPGELLVLRNMKFTAITPDELLPTDIQL